MPAFFKRNFMPSKPVRRAPIEGSPLMQRLRELSLLDGTLPHARFVTTVGKFIVFSEAMTLAEFLSDIAYGEPKAAKSAETEATKLGLDDLKQHYLEARREMMRFIVQSFITENCPVSMRLPLATDLTFSEGDKGLGSYQRFYQLHQSEMQSSILKLQTYIRRYLANYSDHLAQLAALDHKLSNVLAAYSRKAFGIIPLLFAKRFRYLCTEPVNVQQSAARPKKKKQLLGDQQQGIPEQDRAEKGLQMFFLEMQSVLLAELDIRLQPTLGLIEALAIEEEKSTR